MKLNVVPPQSPYFFDDVPHGQQFAVLGAHKQQLLLHRIHGRVSEKMEKSFSKRVRSDKRSDNNVAGLR